LVLLSNIYHLAIKAKLSQYKSENKTYEAKPSQNGLNLDLLELNQKSSNLFLLEPS
jgi:hypothetical protein